LSGANGQTGPCGPDSELFAWTGDGPPQGTPGTDGRWMELWNHVTMSYRRHDDGSLEPLPQRSVDTRMGLERLLMVVQGGRSVFDCDVFQRVRDVVEPGGRLGQVEVDQRDRQPAAEDHIARGVVAVADQLGALGDRASRVSRSPTPHRVGRRYPPSRCLVQRTDQPGQGYKHVVARRLRPVALHVTGDERQHLPPLLIDAEGKRRASEPGVAKVS
jgi:hypothetical protein